MNVKDLIALLNKETNKEKDVFIYTNDDIYEIELIDYTISDRLDINIDYTETTNKDINLTYEQIYSLVRTLKNPNGINTNISIMFLEEELNKIDNKELEE